MTRCIKRLFFGTNGEPDCTEVQMTVELDLPIENPSFLWTWAAGSNDRAYLLAREMRNQFQAAVERAHRLAYEQGYKDGRGKKRKKTKFFRLFRDRDVAW